MASDSPRKKVAIIGAGAAGMVNPSPPIPNLSQTQPPTNYQNHHLVLRLHPIPTPRQIRNPPLRLRHTRRRPSDLHSPPRQPRRDLAERRRTRRLIHISPYIQLLPPIRIRAPAGATPSILRQGPRQLLHQHVPQPPRRPIHRRDRKTRPRVEVD